MPETAAAGTSPTEQLVNVLPLPFAGELHQAKFRQLRNLRTGAIVTHSCCEVLQQLQLIATGVHIDEIDDDHAADIAQLQLARNLNRCLTVGPENRFPSIR